MAMLWAEASSAACAARMPDRLIEATGEKDGMAACGRRGGDWIVGSICNAVRHAAG